jgi:hypothetical protein
MVGLESIFDSSSDLILTWWYPDFMSKVVKYLDPHNLSRISSIIGIENLF